MIISTLSLQDLVEKINNDLGNDFCDKFRYKRKELSNSGRASSYGILFKFVDGDRDWVINEGGGTEIQFHLYYRENTIGYGLGFNAQYVPFANEKTSVEYIMPFVKAFLSLRSKKDKTILSLEQDGFSLIEGDWEDLKNIATGDYFLFGKELQINNGTLPDKEYNQMLENIKNELFNLYVAIWKEKNEMEKRTEITEKYVDLLTKNHNLILTGAPGTGKTYLAKEIAQQLIFGEVKKEMTDEEKKQFNEQCGFVQFHPSYDYTDFVEGLRPKQDDSETVGFERKDGVFKTFCANALENILDSQKSEETLQKENLARELLEDFLQNAIDSDENFETQGTKNNFHIIESKAKTITIDIPKNEKARIISLPKSDLITLLENEADIKGSRDLQTYFNRKYRTQQDSYTFVLYEKLRGINANDKTKNVSLVEKKNYVFIIDEINRGEISKIFGELFFSIDPGYRGEKGMVQTQYQNMVEGGDAFKKGFYVPENVYIIGTMNDIDRSVESMDFAFRRRFAFMEVTAKDSQKMLDSEDAWKDKDGNFNKPMQETIDKIKNRMDNLNAAIESIEGLSSAYHIGASYFMKLKNYRNDDGSYAFDKLWEYHLEGLLYEYLRGTTGLSHKMKGLATAYEYTKADKYE